MFEAIQLQASKIRGSATHSGSQSLASFVVFEGQLLPHIVSRSTGMNVRRSISITLRGMGQTTCTNSFQTPCSTNYAFISLISSRVLRCTNCKAETLNDKEWKGGVYLLISFTCQQFLCIVFTCCLLSLFLVAFGIVQTVLAYYYSKLLEKIQTLRKNIWQPPYNKPPSSKVSQTTTKIDKDPYKMVFCTPNRTHKGKACNAQVSNHCFWRGQICRGSYGFNDFTTQLDWGKAAMHAYACLMPFVSHCVLLQWAQIIDYQLLRLGQGESSTRRKIADVTVTLCHLW